MTKKPHAIMHLVIINSNYNFWLYFFIYLFHFRVNTTPNSGKKRRIDCMENDLLDSAER